LCKELTRWEPAFVASRRCGAAPFACQRPAWCAEPKLAEGERRMVDQAGASWNRVVLRMRQLESLRQVS
jgi:hypothetical protein